MQVGLNFLNTKMGDLKDVKQSTLHIAVVSHPSYPLPDNIVGL